jgi:hypothetical protein
VFVSRAGVVGRGRAPSRQAMALVATAIARLSDGLVMCGVHAKETVGGLSNVLP